MSALCLVAAFATFAGSTAVAQAPAPAPTPATGSIAGRVAHAHRGTDLAGARITIPGTNLATFTDASGYYELPAIPAGPVQLRIFFTGCAARTGTVFVSAGPPPATRDITLGAPPARPAFPRNPSASPAVS